MPDGAHPHLHVHTVDGIAVDMGKLSDLLPGSGWQRIEHHVETRDQLGYRLIDRKTFALLQIGIFECNDGTDVQFCLRILDQAQPFGT